MHQSNWVWIKIDAIFFSFYCRILTLGDQGLFFEVATTWKPHIRIIQARWNILKSGGEKPIWLVEFFEIDM